MNEIPDDVAEALRLQDEAMLLLDRLRSEEPYRRKRTDVQNEKRREFRRWPVPEGVTVEIHSGERWVKLPVQDIGIGGVQVQSVPAWLKGPAPVRLQALTVDRVLALSDIMWRKADGSCGLRFDFLDNDERQAWSDALIDALLARHALG